MKALPILNEKATGIDVGSELLHVSIGGGMPKVFHTLTREVQALVGWLREEGVGTVAMEATGVYWMYLYEALQGAGLEVVVVNGGHVRNVPGRKTDMADCQWLATLHAHGLLRSGFVPARRSGACRTTCVCAMTILRWRAAHVQHMQKALERMNVKLHDVISDLTGVSGLKVVRAIVAGEREPGGCSSCDVQTRAAQGRARGGARCAGRGRPSTFALRQALSGWEFYQGQLRECDQAIEQVLREIGGPGQEGATRARAGRATGGTNTPRFKGCIACW